MEMEPRARVFWGIIYEKGEFPESDQEPVDHIQDIGDEVSYCRIGYPSSGYFGLFVSESLRTAAWADTVELSRFDFVSEPDWKEKLKEVVDKVGLPWRVPKWLLSTYYG